jgi:alpha-D-xyloside xylohydrolase
MFGPALLVNPVSDYKARSRSVYLPASSDWYDLHSGNYFKGGQTIQADAPYSELPLFVKAGSVLPCGPELQYAAEKPADPIRLFVYTGANGSFTLYEDENINYNYEQDKFAVIPFTYNEKEHILTIGTRQGDFSGMLSMRTFTIVWISKQKPSGLDFAVNADEIVTYDGTQQSIKMK